MKRYLAAALLCLTAVSAQANFAMDPQRKPDPKFAKFFLNRADSWLRKNIYDYRSNLTTDEIAFVDSYLNDPRAFGETLGSGFIRGYSFGISIKDSNVTYGPFRFVRPKPSDTDRAAFSRVLKSRGLAPLSDVIGFAFSSDPKEIDVITLVDGKEVVTHYRGSKVVSKRTITRAVEGAGVNPAAPVKVQSDLVVTDDKREWYRHHASIFEDEALSMEGRQLIHKIELGLELSPGVIEFRSQLDYDLAYP